jgi:ABC-2 type transport system permease protein
MAWRKIGIVLLREYGFNFKRPMFLFTAFGVPALTFGAIFLIFQFTVNRETNLDAFRRIGYIDRAGIIDPAWGEATAWEGEYRPVVNPEAADPAALHAYAAQLVLDDQLDAFFVLDTTYTLTGQVDLYSDRNVPQILLDDVTAFLREQIAARSPVDLIIPAERLSDSTVILRDMESGDEISETALAGRLMLPFIFVMVYFMATSTTAQFLMSGVVEEKENRLMEILATSLRPLELLWGKLLGLGALALTQVAFWTLAGILISVSNADAREFISGADFQVGDIVLLIILFISNFLLFSAAMLGIGAAVTAEAESRQIAGLFTFLGVLPMMFLASFFTNPDGPLPMFLTFFPLTAATSLILRLGMTTLPLWQIALSLAIQIVATLAVMWLSAKVFRLGMLMYGKRLSLRAVWQALREGRVVLTAAPTDEAVPPKRKGLFGR